MEEIPSIREPDLYKESYFQYTGLVELEENELYDIKLQYPRLGMKHAVEKCCVRPEIGERLAKAASYLPEGYRLRIWDAWRPFALQEELYRLYSEMVIRDFGLQDEPEEQQKAVIRKYISEPNYDRRIPPVHTTGGAVDVTLTDCRGNELDMGTRFDAFSDEAATAFFEKTDRQEIKNNRRILYHAMMKAGFTNLPSEWWHYDYGDRFWAYYTGKPAVYSGIFTEGEKNDKESKEDCIK